MLWTVMTLLSIGTMVGGLGGLFVVIARSQSRRAKSIHRVLSTTPPTPVASAQPGEVVVVEGTVVPSEQGLVVAQASGRQVVYQHVVVDNVSNRVPPCHEAQECRDFWVQDASGACARISSQMPTVVVRHMRFTATGHSPPGLMTPHPADCLGYQRFSPSLLGFLERITTVNEMLMAKEKVIAPGDHVLALGLARRTPEGTLFLTHAPNVGFVVSTLSAHELRESHRDEHALASGFVWVGTVLCVIGVALCLIGAALAVSAVLTA